MNTPFRNPDTLVIMPAWNESEAIGNTIREVFEFGPPCDVLVVDDGSRDKTAIVAREAGATVLQLPFNMGVGGAMRTGFKYAKNHGYSRVIQVDADGQHDPRDIKAVLDGLQHADIAIGARFADKGNYTVRGPRKWAMKVLAWTISRIAGTPLTDVTSGFRAANTKAIRQYVDHYPAEYLGDTIDSLVVAIRSGCTVKQVAVSMRARQGGTPSHDPMKAAIYLGRSGMALLFALTRKKTEPSTN
ncbi:glycosyltransferase involved in cell wall biosynthesis [Arthrobacter sp. SLBN-112]|uniref:glycosyltransferase family 2 protein n=1 Tax=Arthrobacter sp. SLBN-112 TaxID=2768452 RepID=UPI0011684254|nr:glycosyltransferase family 2 protein [Arthrobacter sp. SLBN-112]TQJ41527.1 glycosyltransferase involved in cell wall biosynthesis [Arthrobacter sp. SLBN-112]